MNAEKTKKITGKEKKGEAIKHSTRKKGITRGKSPHYRHVVTNSRRGMSDKEDEMTVELRDTRKAQPLPIEDAECMFYRGQLSEDNDSQKRIRCGVCFKCSHTLYGNFEGEFFRFRCVQVAKKKLKFSSLFFATRILGLFLLVLMTVIETRPAGRLRLR
jgi:hypothetical protein